MSSSPFTPPAAATASFSVGGTDECGGILCRFCGVISVLIAGASFGSFRRPPAMLKCLVLFSNPPDLDRIRLDKEDKILANLARQFPTSVSLERLHASDVRDIHGILVDGSYDVIQFSGHGSKDGIFLERQDFQAGELVSAQRLFSLLELPPKPPLLVVLLSCYSAESVSVLANAAPFVITSTESVADSACLAFVEGFYEHLFRGRSVRFSFDHAKSYMRARDLASDPFVLSRRHLITQRNSVFVESKPSPDRDTVLINVDDVRSCFGSFDMSEEELCHLLARKLTVHQWIFDGPRERAIIPIGRLLFGEFSWQNATDAIYCRRIIKLRSDTPALRWQLWSRLLTSYNDLAAAEYRRCQRPADPARISLLESAVSLYQHHVRKYLEPAREPLVKLELGDLLPQAEFAITEVDKAGDELMRGRLPQVVIALELALTNYHDVVDGVQPAEESCP
jgi:hypothetical protein